MCLSIEQFIFIFAAVILIQCALGVGGLLLLAPSLKRRIGGSRGRAARERA